MLALTTFLLIRSQSFVTRARRRSRSPIGQAGQASVEYALVMLGAGIVATLVIAWASKTDLLETLFDHVLKLIKGKAS